MAEAAGRLLSRAESTGEPSDYLSYLQLSVSSASDEQLAAAVGNAFETLRTTTGPDGPDDLLLHNCGVHVLRRSESLLHRIKLSSAWLRVEHDPLLAQGDIAHLQKASASGDPVFASSENLTSGIYMLDAYIGPLVGAMSPAVWAFNVPRSIGVVVFSIGRALSGTRSHASELLQVIPVQGADEAIEFNDLAVDSAAAAIKWWGDRLNDLFAVASDPAVFTDRDGAYVPSKHLHAILSIEQLFRRVSSIQTSHRDSNARRVLLFTVLDTVERLTGKKIEQLCKLRFAEDTLEAVRQSMSPSAQAILIPAAERSVTALRGVQDGFFLARQMGAETVDIPDSKGVLNPQSLEVSAAKYIKVLRNATHGHGSEKADRAAETDALLANHNGYIPHELAALGYLYLLRILVNPQSLRMKLYAAGSVIRTA